MPLLSRVSAVITVMLLASVVVGCGSGTSQPTPTTAPATMTNRPLLPTNVVPESTLGPSSPPPNPTANPLFTADPCSIVPASVIVQLGGTEPGKAEKIGYARTCQWPVPGQYSLNVGIFDTFGLDNVHNRTDTKEVDSVKVGSGTHDALRWESFGTCNYSIALGPTSRLDLVVSSGIPEKGCATAKIMAEAVEPTLPTQVR